MTALKKVLLISLCLSLCGAQPAHAEKTPLPEKKQEKLNSLQNKVEKEKSHQEELKKKAETLEKDMKGLKTNLISTTQSVQKQERSLQDIQKKLDELEKQKLDAETVLKKQRTSLAGLIVALERIRRLPPETLVARPDAPLQTAQAATVMGTILPEINKRASQLKTDLEKLSDLEKNLTEQKSDMEKSAQKLKSDQEKMNKLMAERAEALKDTRNKVAAKSLEIAVLTKEAKDFSDLIKRLEKKNREIDARTGNAIHSKKADKNWDSKAPALGTGRAPVSGIIKTHYGEADDIGATSKGLVFSARSGSVVVAPLGGIVRYAGDFRNYGNIVLIEHRNKFHSLVAGLGKVATFVGQRVEAGEPLGYLPDDSGRLYYELRYQGDPVNPSKKFSKLE
jgi:septal ring factor EnvC (AmiA/AmiB activator)